MKRPLQLSRRDVTNAWITASVSLTLMKGQSWTMRRRWKNADLGIELIWAWKEREEPNRTEPRGTDYKNFNSTWWFDVRTRDLTGEINRTIASEWRSCFISFIQAEIFSIWPGRADASFSSNPAPTHITCSFQISLNDLISWIRCV